MSLNDISLNIIDPIDHGYSQFISRLEGDRGNTTKIIHSKEL